MSTLLESAIKKLNTLDEAFSDTMPDWMRQGFQSYVKHRKGNFNTPFSQARYGSRYQGEQNLFNLLLNAGYDLSKMTVVSAPVPNKLEDEIFDNPDALPVFHIVTPNDNKIWIQGINDQEQFLDENGKESKFSYMNNAKLKKYVKDFAYIDLSAPETHSVEKTTDPNDAKLYSGKPVDYNKVSRYSDKQGLSLTKLNDRRFAFGKDRLKGYYGDKPDTELFDKSGYYHGDQLISDTLRQKLKDYKNKRIPQRVF